MNNQITLARAGPLGSWRHTTILCVILIAIAALGFLSLQRAPSQGGAGAVSGAALYLPLLAAEWGLFLYVRMGLRRRGKTISGLISARPLTLRAIAVDMGLGALMLGAFLAASYGFDLAFGPASEAGTEPLLVRNAADIPLWILLALSAGVVEELTFRGYLQRQFGALLGNRWLGALAQAVLFGVTHGYQGPALVLKIALLGMMFGALALCRRSLIPGIIAHASVDVIGGLAAFR
ncbi:MAG TPA: CPBP family intramembrane glutamic endopeptidase [Allosphingosinicella sp.]|jgi:membrane protease YdiL (CAAX protease family)|nr:CPBP family intramembrane glutamic endopeptidase [Allosphingosinicella sp.]